MSPRMLQKIYKQIILVRLENVIITWCLHFSWRNITQMNEVCVFAVNDTKDYYRKIGTPKFVCFIDIKCVFDRVFHSSFFEKLSRAGTQTFIIQVLKSCLLQQISFSWNGELRLLMFTLCVMVSLKVLFRVPVSSTYMSMNLFPGFLFQKSGVTLEINIFIIFHMRVN